MPKRTDLSKILIIGSGPIVIGQSAEFDYSGTQACKALKSEGYEVVLANSNPATIMTDPELADRTYIEPLTREYLEEIIRLEREMSPNAGFAVLPTVGGQTALNLAVDLSDGGVLDKYNVQLIGANIAAIKKAEDRLFFKDAMQKIGLDVPKSALVNTKRRRPGRRSVAMIVEFGRTYRERACERQAAHSGPVFDVCGPAKDRPRNPWLPKIRLNRRRPKCRSAFLWAAAGRLA